jgi:hypothetical protein
MLLSNDTVTSSLCCSPRISFAAQSSAASSLTLLLTRILNYGEFDDIHDEDHDLAGVNAGVDVGEDAQQLTVSEASTGTKAFCDVDNCPGRNFQPGAICIVCEADLIHLECCTV